MSGTREALSTTTAEELLVCFTPRQHEMIWEIVAANLPEKVADNPELHRAAARLAGAVKLGPVERPIERAMIWLGLKKG